jgi:hypothetical protein
MNDSGVPPTTEPAPARAVPQAVPVVRDPLRTWLTVLTIVVVIHLLITIVLGVGAAIYSTTYFGMAPGDDYMQAEMIASDVGYYVSVGDVDGYMDLYARDDEHVDREAVRREFEQVAGSFDATQTSSEFTSDQVVVYEDEETGETIVRITLSAYDYETGRPIGRRLSVWALLEDEFETVLTGPDGRQLSDGESVW